jgi:hypothetical protein
MCPSNPQQIAIIELSLKWPPTSSNRTAEQQNVILIDVATLREAERMFESCEHCHPQDADIPFDWGSDPTVTDYILEQPAKCPNCRREIFEKTLIEPCPQWMSISSNLSKNASRRWLWADRIISAVLGSQVTWWLNR